VGFLAVIGVPSSRRRESPIEVVVADGLSGPDLVAWARDRLAHFTCPAGVHFVDALPRSASGKLLKRVLRERYG
jgi:fatty-acyl-CoA synthase